MLRLLPRVGIFAYRVFSRPLSVAVPALPAGIDFRVLAPQDIALFTDAELEVDESKARAALARSEVCVGALHAGALAGYAWFAREAAPHIGGIWMDFDREAIYTYRAFVKSAFRGRGIAQALYQFADARFIQAGRRYTILCIEVGNKASRAAAKRSGARAVGYAGYVRAAGRILPFRSRGAGSVGFRFVARNRSES